MKKKLLVVGSNSIHVHNFIALVQEKFDDVLLLTNEVNEDSTVKSVAANFSLGISALKTLHIIKEILNDFHPSVIHIQQANTYAFLMVLATRGLNIPIVLTAWGSDVLLSPQKSFLLKKMVQYVLKRVDVITADSDHVLNSAQKLVDKKLTLHNVNFGIDFEECGKVEKENIIYSNRLHKELYNIDKIIISFAKFMTRTNDEKWKLVIAGSGEETEELVGLTKKLNIVKHVQFVGFLSREENNEYYCKAKIYVSIPRSDSVSISLVEAILCGCIPFVSNLDANLELIHHGKNGFVEDDLENIHFEKFQHVNRDIFEKTREKLKIFFSKDYNQNLYFAIYEKVMK